MNFIPVNEPSLDGNELKYVTECIETGWISSEGPYVKCLEEGMAQLTQRQEGIAVANCSAALDIAVKALGIGPGDEVILPTFTIISCAAAIVRQGAIPVLVDSDLFTWNMAIDQIEAKITPRTKAIMIVHLYGLPVDIDPILVIATKYHLAIIEDAAEMHGQSYKGKPCGSFGTLSTFSFYANKHITTGEGGMIVTDDPQLAERCRSLRNLCFQPQQRFIHTDLGWNYRLSNIQAAIGVAQLERLPAIIERKRAMGKQYTELLQDIKQLQRPLPATDYAENIYWVYGLVLQNETAWDAKTLMQQLGRNKIGTRPFFWPMHEQPVFLEMGLFCGESYPIAETLARRGFYLPSGLALTDQQIRQVSRQLKHTINNLD
jgi:perosamine synthetase